jgi:Zn-dependent protease
MDILGIIISLTILLFSSVLHEVVHGWVAYRLGDPTAKLMGRLTLNPIKHLDPYMSIIMPILLFIGSGGRFIFGGAKPVPVDIFNLRDGIKDFALVSVMGPISNLVLAIIGAILMHIFLPNVSFSEATASGIFGYILSRIVYLNLLLAIFNLMPIPPLDGSRVFALLLPERTAASYLAFGSGPFGFMLLFFLLFFPIGGFSLIGLVSSLITFGLKLLGY